MVDVTQGKAYARPLPRSLSRDLVEFIETEFGKEGLYWLAAESEEQESQLAKNSARRSPLYSHKRQPSMRSARKTRMGPNRASPGNRH